ncbi:histidine kinase [uncultured Flavobacterium sp.]|uniref:sensor histidine kinase n=1 Tax=uncultured Flavobacterium sp. TaxID=165435 RepID=UPI0025CE7C58|nr:histidine kinase [uncultured Flavobacterium sp.]
MKFKSIVENKWWQEIIILIFSFILFTLNDWILILSWKGFYTGLVYFFILYSHAQVNRYFLLPVLLKKHRPVLYLLMTVLLLFVFSVILYETSTEFLYKNCFLYKSAHQKSYQFQVATLVGTLICILGTFLMLEYYRDQKKRTNKKLLYNQVQLNALKGQLNPHFLFNTFNTLYGISLQYPERTSDMIMKVSQLMRYQVENGNKEFVSLQDELEFISSYIELERERVGYRCDINFQQDVDFESNYKIAPMLLITFIENAFKHGACTIENCYVNIKIKTSEDKIYLVISNSIPTKKKKIVSTKIGLKNTMQRLAILYPEKHILDIKQGELEYEVNLEIDLN